MGYNKKCVNIKKSYSYANKPVRIITVGRLLSCTYIEEHESAMRVLWSPYMTIAPRSDQSPAHDGRP